MMTIADRKTGIHCECPLDAFHMFASTWYHEEYEVPRLPIRPGDFVIDIGANHGFFALYAASKGAEVFAFEPSPTVFKRLESNIRSNGLEGQITARPWAISGSPGEAQLLVTERLGGGMSTIHEGFAQKTKIPVTERLAVECHTLSEVLETFDIDTVRRCKIDAEGSELAILKGLDRKDRARFESIVLEFHLEAYRLQDLLSELIGWGSHQVSLIDESEFSGNVLRVVSNGSLLRMA